MQWDQEMKTQLNPGRAEGGGGSDLAGRQRWLGAALGELFCLGHAFEAIPHKHYFL